MKNPFEGKEIWSVVGSQDLYGEETLKQVAEQSRDIVNARCKSSHSCEACLKPTP